MSKPDYFQDRPNLIDQFSTYAELIDDGARKLVSEIFHSHPIVYISPHYDELPLSSGGLALALQKKLPIININVFSRSQYVPPIYESELPIFNDSDRFSAERIKFVSSHRQADDDECLESMMINNRKYLEKNEAPLRGYGLGDGKSGITFPATPYGWWEKPEEKKLVNELKEKFKVYMSNENNVFIPLGIKYHIDHIVVRRAAILAAQELHEAGNLRATIFFYEDQPYAGLSKINSTDWKDANKIINLCDPIDIVINLGAKINLINYYPSQYEAGYPLGVGNRALEIGSETMPELPFYPKERILKLNINRIHELDSLDDFLDES